RLGAQLAQDRAVSLQVFFLAGISLPIQVQELGPVQADAVGSAFQAMGGLMGEFNITQQQDSRSVLGFRRQLAQLSEAALERSETTADALVALQRLPIRIEDDQAVIAIHDHGVAANHVAQELTQTNDSGNF